MAFQMDWTAPNGTEYAASYWVPAQINIDVLNHGAHLTFLGFRDAAAAAAKLAAIGSKSYDLVPADFVTYFSPGVWVGGVTPMSQVMLYATNNLDTNGVSFFNGASTVA